MNDLTHIWLIWSGPDLVHVAVTEDDADALWEDLFVNADDEAAALLRRETRPVSDPEATR